MLYGVEVIKKFYGRKIFFLCVFNDDPDFELVRHSLIVDWCRGSLGRFKALQAKQFHGEALDNYFNKMILSQKYDVNSPLNWNESFIAMFYDEESLLTYVNKKSIDLVKMEDMEFLMALLKDYQDAYI